MNEEQKNNFRKLSDYLLSGKLTTKFNMSALAHDFDRTSLMPMEVNPTTLACGCALGHGPLAGIVTSDVMNWSSYSERYFGCSSLALALLEPLNEFVFQWCFSGGWACVDNTPEGAGKRIRWMLEHDFQIPENHHKQRLGLTPLCY